MQIVSQQIQGTNKQVFQTMQTAIYEFMNNMPWTNHVYAYDERIECNFMFNITEQLSADEVAEAVIQTAPYSGFPRALNGLAILSDVL